MSRSRLKVIRIGVVLGLILAGLAACSPNPGLGDLERVLRDTWQSYARRHIAPDGRVVLAERGGESISEAQAYALMRALWLAARRGWQPPKPWPAYDAEARRVAADILAKEVVHLPSGELLLAPGNWHEFEAPYLLNPSYSSPGAYHLFARAGFDPRWERLRQNEYAILTTLGQGVGDMPGVGLFPDWVRLDVQGSFSPARGRDTNFGWEAVRLPWRIALDRLWFGEARTARLLGQNFLPFFQQEWQSRGKLLAVYSYEGKPLVTYESPVLYAGVLGGALAAGDQEFARRMALKILSFYREKDGESYFDSPDNYYANNWAWLGLALYAG